MSDAEVTRYGFDWGPAKIERITHIEGRGRVMEIRTDHARIQVYITEKGRKIDTYVLEPYKKD